MIIPMLFISALGMHSATLTAEQVAQKTAATLTTTKGLSVSFTMTANGKKTSGTIKCAGTKFHMDLPQVSTWYNGKALYIYNPSTQETTVSDPTAQELAESNPLLYVKNGTSAYTCKFSTVKIQGKYIVDLFPRDVRSAIKKLSFRVNSSDFHIERIEVVATSGTTVIEVSSLKTGITVPQSEFEYPKARYPNTEIVDLR